MTTTAEVLEREPTTAPAQAKAAASSKKRLVAMVIGAAVVLGGGTWYVAHRGLESTDNAQVDADVVAVPARIGGNVTKVLFVENQTVKAGDVLAELDDVPAKARLAQAEAALQAAQASADAADADADVAETNAFGNKSAAEATLQSMSAGAASSSDQIKEAEAQVQTAESNLAQATLERDRTKNLFDTGALSKAQLDQAETAYNVANSALAGAKARLATMRKSSAEAQSRVSEASARLKMSSNVKALVDQAKARAKAAHAQVDTAKALRDLAALDVSYTKIVAPSDGVVSKKSINVGQSVSAGQTIVQLVPPALWVTANFKETQLTHMHVGQPATFSVDAFPGVEVKGEVESLSGATGSRFTLLPPDNATGNFTKVVQRVPVRIKIREAPSNVTLRPGMSVELTVNTRS